MTKPTSNHMNQPKHGQLTGCQLQIESALAEFRATLDTAARLTDATPADDRESIEADLCLASRSAYFDFYTWLVLHGEVDIPAERELDELFQRSLCVMQPGRFKESIQSRFEEFKAECAYVRTGSTSSDLASSTEL